MAIHHLAAANAGDVAVLEKASLRPQLGALQCDSSTSDAMSGSSNSIEKVEHLALGFGKSQELNAEAIIEADINDPKVHEHMNPRLFLSLTAMSFLWVGSQLPLYLYGAVIVYIYSDVGGADGVFIWMIIGYLIANAALCPFVGALSDMFGRKAVAITGQAFLILGPVVVSSAQDIGAAIAGMTLAGLGAGLNELIALAGTSELVPVHKRALYVSIVSITILPFCPSVLWGNLITRDASWRWVGGLIGIWNFVGLILVAICYTEPVKVRPPRVETIRKIDFVGGFLSTSGVVCFLMGMQFGAQLYSWTSAHVLAPLFVGLALIVAFFVWEVRYAPYPMVPRALFSKDKRTMIAILLITFFSGGNYTAVILFWPPQSYNMYGEGYISNGIRALPIGLGIVTGSFLGLTFIYLSKGRIRPLMIFWTLAMTAFTGAMSVATTHNLPIVYAMITLAAVSGGAVVLPCSIISQIITPTDLIGTITAISLSLRYIGGCIAFTAYFNIFYTKFYAQANQVGFEVAVQGISYDYDTIYHLVSLAGYSQFAQLRAFIADSPLVHQKDTAYEFIISRTQNAFAIAYRWPYWISIPFGVVCVVAACGMNDVRKATGVARER